MTFDMRKWEKARVAEASRRVKVIFSFCRPKEHQSGFVLEQISHFSFVCALCAPTKPMFSATGMMEQSYTDSERERLKGIVGRLLGSLGLLFLLRAFSFLSCLFTLCNGI